MRREESGSQPLILVLGSPNAADGTLSTVSLGRCDQALAEHKREPRAKILPTGGFGAHFNTTQEPHGVYLKRHLIQRGVPAHLILDPVESRNTIEDARLARPVVEAQQPSRLVVVTSDYHAKRAEYVFSRVLSGWPIEYAICSTNTETCELDLEALRQHERTALANLQLRGLPPEE